MEIGPTHTETTWIENLAVNEINMNETGVVDLHEHLNPMAYLEEASITFMAQIRDRIELYTDKFNQYRGHGEPSSHIKIFKISNTVNDFMLFRNSLRMIFARKANNVISVAFLSNGKDLFAPRLNQNEEMTPSQGAHEIRAHIGPFNQIYWQFENTPVDLDCMVRHYLTEFIKQSSR